MVSTAIAGNDFLAISKESEVKTGESSASGKEFEKVMDSIQNSSDKFNKSDTDKTGKADEVKNLFEKNISTGSKVNSNPDISDEDMNEAMQDIATELVQQIMEIIEEKFQVSTEDIEDAITEIGCDIKDLLNGNGLAELIADLTGKENVMEILTDTELSGIFKDMVNQIQEIVTEFADELGMSGEEFKESIENLDFTVMDAISVEEVTVQEEKDNTPTVEYGDNMPTQSDDSENITVVVEKTAANANEPEDNKGEMHQSLAQSFTETLANVAEENGIQTEDVKPEHIIRQIVDEIKVSVSEEMNTLEMQLNPEHLGKLSIQIASRNGMVTAQIIVQNEMVKEAVESQVAQLREALDSQGVKVEAVEVTVASRQFEENLDSENQNNKEEHKSRKHISQEDLDEINKTANIQEIIEEEMMKADGNTVSIRA